MSTGLVAAPQGFGSNPQTFSEQAGFVIKHMFNGNRRSVLERGLVFLTQSDGYDAWSKERVGDIRNIFKGAQDSSRIQSGIEERAKVIADATHTTQEATGKQERLEGELTQAQEAFRKSNAQLESRLQKVHDLVREEGRVALWSFKNPLVSRVGRFMANWGGWTLGAFGSATFAVGLAAHGPTLAQSCSSLSSLSALGQCTAAVAAPSLLVPLVATTVLGLIIFKVKQIAQKIFIHKREEDTLKAKIQRLEVDRQHQIGEILRAKAECSEKIKNSTQSSEIAQKETEALKKEQTEVDTALKTVRNRLHSDTLNQAIGQIETGLGLPDDQATAVVKHQLTVPAMKVAVNTMLGMAENQVGPPRAIAQGPAQPAIAGPAIASAAAVEVDDGTGLGSDIPK